jgi:hypothetical protein
MTQVRPDLALLWPSFTFFPLAALAVLVFGASSGDPVMIVIGLLLLAVNILIVVNQAYFTTLALEGDAVVFRTNFGLHEERVPIGSLQRIDAKRYPGAHSGRVGAVLRRARPRLDGQGEHQALSPSELRAAHHGPTSNELSRGAGSILVARCRRRGRFEGDQAHAPQPDVMR